MTEETDDAEKSNQAVTGKDFKPWTMLGRAAGPLGGTGQLSSALVWTGIDPKRWAGIDAVGASLAGVGQLSSALIGAGIDPKRWAGLGAVGASLAGMGQLSSALIGAGIDPKRWAGLEAVGASLAGMGQLSSALIGAGIDAKHWAGLRAVTTSELSDLLSSSSVGSKAFQALIHADSATLTRVAENIFASQQVTDIAITETVAVADFAELETAPPAESAEAEVVSALSSDGDLSLLSRRANALLRYLFAAFLLLANYLAIQNGVREELCYWQPRVMPGLTIGQAGKAIRAAMCVAEVPEEFLRGYRMVKGVGVRLRTEPSMKSEIVQVTLEDRALLEILDSSNRDWLHVSVVGEDSVTGWVSRKYTHPLLR
jgi:hypothetical protein